MKKDSMGIVKLILSILVVVVFYLFFDKLLHLVGIKISIITNFVKYLLICLIEFIIYHSNINAGKSKFNKTFLSSLIYSIICLIILVVITILIHNFAGYLGYKISYPFENYFDRTFTLNYALNLIIECLFMPFLLCIIFPLGFSNIFSKIGVASILSSLTYGILYGLSLNVSLQSAILTCVTPAIIIGCLTYLYKTNQNIWSVMITYMCFQLFGIFVLNYII